MFQSDYDNKDQYFSPDYDNKDQYFSPYYNKDQHFSPDYDNKDQYFSPDYDNKDQCFSPDYDKKDQCFSPYYNKDQCFSPDYDNKDQYFSPDYDKKDQCFTFRPDYDNNGGVFKLTCGKSKGAHKKALTLLTVIHQCTHSEQRIFHFFFLRHLLHGSEQPLVLHPVVGKNAGVDDTVAVQLLRRVLPGLVQPPRPLHHLLPNAGRHVVDGRLHKGDELLVQRKK